MQTALAAQGASTGGIDYFRGLTDSMPSADLLWLYRGLGGPIVTIGSGSHAPAHWGPVPPCPHT